MQAALPIKSRHRWGIFINCGHVTDKIFAEWTCAVHSPGHCSVPIYGITHVIIENTQTNEIFWWLLSLMGNNSFFYLIIGSQMAYLSFSLVRPTPMDGVLAKGCGPLKYCAVYRLHGHFMSHLPGTVHGVGHPGAHWKLTWVENVTEYN